MKTKKFSYRDVLMNYLNSCLFFILTKWDFLKPIKSAEKWLLNKILMQFGRLYFIVGQVAAEISPLKQN